MKRTIIYVFGPKRLYEKYLNGYLISQEEGGWLKIGMTSACENVDKWEAALRRANQEQHTGVPEVCKLYQVYEYPELPGKPDDKVRQYLTDDLYEVRSSKKDNLEIEDRDIKAGREFVYNLSQKHVKNAIGMFERDLLMGMYQKDEFDELMNCLKRNQEDLDNEDSDGCDSSESSSFSNPSSTDSEWNIWNRVLERIKKKISTTNLRTRNDSQPLTFNSKHPDFSYYVAYNKKRAISYVEFRISKGEEGFNKLSELIANNPSVKKNFSASTIRRGTRNPEKWSFFVSDTLEGKTEDNIVDWYSDTILKLYETFESCEIPENTEDCSNKADSCANVDGDTPNN